MLTENSNYKYVHFLEYILTNLKSGHKSGISYFQIRDNYTAKTGIIFYESEFIEFFKLYEGVYFKELDGYGHRLILTDKSKYIIKRYGSVSNYLNGKNQLSFLSRFFSWIGKIQQKLKIKPIIQLIITAITSLSIIWKFIFGIIISGIGGLLAYLLIEWVKSI